MGRDAIIRLDNLSIGYRSRGGSVRYVAKDINATLFSGELTAILGANGIGKSTLIRTITKAQPALSGDVTMIDRPILDYTPRELAKQMSVVLTDKLDLKNTRVFDLVGMGRAPYTGFWGVLESSDIDIVQHSLEQVGIISLRDRMVDTLSDGERQKVMIAKALAQQTPVILLDEPTAFLDFPSKVETMQLLHRLAKELGKTILLSTHDLDLALQVADKIWIMDGSSRLHIGVPEDLALDGTLSHFFIRKGVVFDKGSGLFRIDYKTDRHAKVEGSGFRYAMVCKALLRCGISVDEDESDLLIRVLDHDIEVKLRGKEICSLESVEQMIDYIGLWY